VHNKWHANTIWLSVLVTLYLFTLNFFSNQEIVKIYQSILPALIFLLLLLIMGSLHRYVWKAIAIPAIFIASITLFFKWRYQATVTEDILLSGMINDATLTTEMLSLPLLVWLLLTAVIPIGVILRIAIRKSILKKQIFASLAVLLLMGITIRMQGYEYRARGQIRDYKTVQAIGSFSPLDILYAYKKARKAHKVLRKKYLQAKKVLHQYTDEEEDRDQLIVLIVGESSRGDHFSLNGYDKETTPRLESIKNLYSFRHAKSCDTLTLRSMHYMFSPLTCRAEDGSVSEAAFTEVFRSLGYQVEIYSLQTLNAFYHYLGYDALVSKYAVVREQKSGTKDISLLPYAQKSIEGYTKGKKLIVIHTLGSHQSYFDRIEMSQESFKPTCNSADVALCEREELVNSYDNTIVAIDSFIASIIRMLSRKRAMLVYLSDHGESLGEGGVYFHGKPKESAPLEQFKIPFLFWFSDSYRRTPEAKRFTDWIDTFSLDANVSHDYLFHSILGCAGISSEDGGIDKKLNFCQE
jgi:KDO II ethanolaminephosphotransferase